MSTTQEHFAYVLKNGLARSNRFEVLIPLPGVLNQQTSNVDQPKTSSFLNEDVIRLIQSFSGAGTAEISRGLNMSIESTEIPSKSLTTTDVRYNGDFYKLPYAVIYGAQQFTFRVSRDMYEKNIIDEWMNQIFNPTTHEVRYMDDYVTNVVINQLDERDRIVYSVMLKDAFPTMCNPLTVSNEESNQFHRLSVMFNYRRWQRIGEGDGADSGVSSLSQTPFGPLLNPILSNPAVQKALDVFEQNTGIDLEGEAVNIYNQVDEIVKSTTGTSINQSVSLIESIRASTQLNDKLTSVQKAEIIGIIDKALQALRN